MSTLKGALVRLTLTVAPMRFNVSLGQGEVTGGQMVCIPGLVFEV